MRREEAGEALRDQDALLCMRFDDDSRLLPVPRVVIKHVDYQPGNHMIYFKMGPLYDFTEVAALEDACVRLPDDEVGDIGDRLFFRSGLDVSRLLFADRAAEQRAWIKLCDLLAADDTLNINVEAKNAMFLRFDPPVLSREAIPSHFLHMSFQEGAKYGAVLDEGSTYELAVTHRIPALIGTDSLAPPIPVDYRPSTENLELSRLQEDFTGNYQTHTLVMFARRPSGTFEELVVGPAAEAFPLGQGESVRTAKLHIPLKIRRSLWYRVRTKWFWVAVLASALSFGDFVGDLVSGDPVSFWGLVVSVALFTLASVIIHVR